MSAFHDGPSGVQSAHSIDFDPDLRDPGRHAARHGRTAKSSVELREIQDAVLMLSARGEDRWTGFSASNWALTTIWPNPSTPASWSPDCGPSCTKPAGFQVLDPRDEVTHAPAYGLQLDLMARAGLTSGGEADAQRGTEF